MNPLRIRALRDRLQLSQGELAVLFRVTTSSVSLWECGRRIPLGPAAILLELLDSETCGKQTLKSLKRARKWRRKSASTDTGVSVDDSAF